MVTPLLSAAHHSADGSIRAQVQFFLPATPTRGLGFPFRHPLARSVKCKIKAKLETAITLSPYTIDTFHFHMCEIAPLRHYSRKYLQYGNSVEYHSRKVLHAYIGYE